MKKPTVADTMRMKKQTLIRGAIILAVGSFSAKMIGALYRVPLLSLVGGKGMGFYQLIYPVYCLLLTLSATGIPSAVATLVAKKKAQGFSEKSVLYTALKLFSLIGFLGTVFMCLFAPLLAKLQNTREVFLGYLFLAPSVFFTSLIAVFRGYFQGKKDMRPTAFSETIEQLIKVGFGLLFAYLYRGNLRKTVPLLLLAVTISEFFTLGFLYFLYKRDHTPHEQVKNPLFKAEKIEKIANKEILSLSLPVTFSSATLPLCSLVESVLIVRLLSGYTSFSVTLYGLYAGGAVTIVNLPVSLCYGIATASVPSVAESKDGGEKRRKILYALSVTFFSSLVFAIGLFFFAEQGVGVLFSNLSPFEKATLVRLVKILSLSAIFHSCAQTLSACLTAQGKPLHSAISLTISVVVRLILDFILVKNAKISIFGCAISANIGYFVAFFIDLVYNMRCSKGKKTGKGVGYDNGSELGRRERRFDGERKKRGAFR